MNTYLVSYTYLVSWEIEIDAASEREAAAKALAVQRDREVREFASGGGNAVRVDVGDLSECQNCGKLWEPEELREIKDLHLRVEAGEPMPSGECPECGALAQPAAKGKACS